jgi:hypothetical protein
LTGYTAGAPAFNDLGSGSVYGSTSIAVTSTTFGAMPKLEIDLSGGINDIALALGGLFALGGGSNLGLPLDILQLQSVRATHA